VKCLGAVCVVKPIKGFLNEGKQFQVVAWGSQERRRHGIFRRRNFGIHAPNRVGGAKRGGGG